MKPPLLPLILLDRDGTLVAEEHYPTDPRKVRLLPGVVTGIKRLKRAGYSLIVVSNQSGVGRGLVTRTQMNRVSQRFLELLKGHGASIDGYFICPHAPAERCGCRKPKLKLVRQGAKRLHRSWKRSISVGDRPSDVELGQRTGGWGILVRTGYGRQAWTGTRPPDFKANTFASAVRWILKRKETSHE